MKTRDKILYSSLDLFIDKGFHGTSTKMILESSGVSNGALYHHFPTKEDIIQELYFKIKDEIRDYLYEATRNTVGIRSFLWRDWSACIRWALENPRKKMFIDMFSKSTIIRNCNSGDVLKKFEFITKKIEDAIEQKELVSQDLFYFLHNFTGSTDAITNYLIAFPEKDTEEFLEFAFNQYWRSVVNF